MSSFIFIFYQSLRCHTSFLSGSSLLLLPSSLPPSIFLVDVLVFLYPAWELFFPLPFLLDVFRNIWLKKNNSWFPVSGIFFVSTPFSLLSKMILIVD